MESLMVQIETLKEQLATILTQTETNINNIQLDLKDIYVNALHKELFILLDKIQDKYYNQTSDAKVVTTEG